jgi:hypothetical protein
LLGEDYSKICTICTKAIADFGPALGGFHRVKIGDFGFWSEVSGFPNLQECF